MNHANARRQEPVPEMADVSDKDFAGLYDTYYMRIRGFIFTTVRDAWQAEDLTQETFLRARKHIGMLKDLGKIKPWLFRIAFNTCMDHCRSASLRENTSQTIDPMLDLISSEQPQRLLEQQQMNACFQKHLLLLSESYRTVLWLFDALGFTHKEISTILNIDVGAVRVRLHRARSKMKSVLQQNCTFERDDRNVFVCVQKERSSKACNGPISP